MKLRWTILAVILVTFVGLVAVLTFSLQGILVPHFRDEENRSADLNVQRVLNLMDSERNSLTQAVHRWASSDEIVALMRSANPAAFAAAGGSTLLTGLDLDLMAFASLQGDIMYASLPASSPAGSALPEELTAHLLPGDRLLRDAVDHEPISGLLATGNGPLLVVSSPILKSSGAGPAAGTLLAGRYLDTEEIDRLGGVLRFPLTLAAYDQPTPPQEFADARAGLIAGDSVVILPVSETQIAGYALLEDLYGAPAYILRVEQGRTSYRNGQIVLLYLFIAMIMGALLFSVMSFLAIDRMVLSRISRLGREVTRIGASGDLSARVTATGRDELSRIGEEINGMLASLQTLSHRLVDIQESERRTIALELHDEIGQLLTGLKMQLETNPEASNTIARQSLDKARALTDELIQRVRNLSLDLRPSMLDDLGLLPALVWHIDRYTALTGVRVDFSQSGIAGCRFTPELESTVYRVVQEALTNVARHAGVQHAVVHVGYLDSLLTVQVEDRGSGFAVEPSLENGQARGLRGIKERVALVGGSVTIDSVPGWGTSILVEVPAIALAGEGNDHDHHLAGG